MSGSRQPVRFYCADPGAVALQPPELGVLSLSRWQPSRDGRPSGIFETRANFAWWALDAAGAFPRRDLSVYAIHDGRSLLHRLLVTPRWYRFPFMGAADLQLGDLWTSPHMRGRGLAAQAIAAVHRDTANSCRALWYVVGEHNLSSIRLIERIGYRLAGVGERTHPLGFNLLGRFKIRGRAQP